MRRGSEKAVVTWCLLIISLYACKGGEEGQLYKGVVEKKGGGLGEVQRIDTESFPKDVAIAPEIISVKLSPLSPKVNDSIKADVLKKGNTSVMYQWALNEKKLEVSGDTLPPGEFKRGDKVSLTVIPIVGHKKGNPVTVFTYIFNSLPEIVSDIRDVKYKDSIFTYRVKASDPDGDPLTYSLKSAPPGMTIDPNGMIKWNIPPDFKGKAPVTVSVTDGQGGEAIYSFEVSIGFENK